MQARLFSIRHLQIALEAVSKGPVTEEAGPTGGFCPFMVAILPVPALSTTTAMPTATAAPVTSGCRSASESRNNQEQSRHFPGGGYNLRKREVAA